MAINFVDAVAAYQRAVRRDTVPGGPADLKPNQGSGFEDVLRAATENAIGSVREAERQSLMAAAGTADLTNVVTAVGKAELTLQTVVTLRDRVIQAYQEILRMPI